MQTEIEAAQDRQGFVASRRYRPSQWDEVERWKYYSAGGEPWFGFEAVRDLDGLPKEILLIPLAGHTRVMPVSLSTRRRAGSSTRVMPTSTGTKWVLLSHAAHQACGPISG
jgi:hypothetical protein